jgi:hypothetical protein
MNEINQSRETLSPENCPAQPIAQPSMSEYAKQVLYSLLYQSCSHQRRNTQSKKGKERRRKSDLESQVRYNFALRLFYAHGCSVRGHAVYVSPVCYGDFPISLCPTPNKTKKQMREAKCHKFVVGCGARLYGIVVVGGTELCNAIHGLG